MARPVRPILFIALTLPALALAKPKPEPTPEPKLYDRITNNDREKVFDMAKMSRTGTTEKTFYARGARTDSFYYEQKFKASAYETPEYQSKGFWGRLLSFGTKSAPTEKTYGTKSMDTKTAATKDLWDGNKLASTRALPDGKREYLGPESKKLHKALDPMNLPKITGSDEHVTELKTIEDVRALLNKN